jgi:hypothetical protein
MNIDPGFLKRCEQYEQALHCVTDAHQCDFNAYYYIPIPFTQIATNISRDSVLGRFISIVRLVFDYCLFGYGVSREIDLGIFKLRSFDEWNRDNNIYYYKRDAERCFKIWDEVLGQFDIVKKENSDELMNKLIERVQNLIIFTGLANICCFDVDATENKHSLYKSLLEMPSINEASKLSKDELYKRFDEHDFKDLICSAEYYYYYSKVVEKLINVGLNVDRQFDFNEMTALLHDDLQGEKLNVRERTFLKTSLDVTGTLLYAEPSLSNFLFTYKNQEETISNLKTSLYEIAQFALKNSKEQSTQFAEPKITNIHTYVKAVLQASSVRREQREKKRERIDYLSNLKVDDVVRSFFHVTYSLEHINVKEDDLKRILGQIQINIICSFDQTLDIVPSELVANKLKSYKDYKPGMIRTVDVRDNKQLILPSNFDKYYSFLSEKSFKQVQYEGMLPIDFEKNVRFREDGSICFFPSDCKKSTLLDVHLFVLTTCKKLRFINLKKHGIYNDIMQQLFNDSYKTLNQLIVSMAKVCQPSWISETECVHSRSNMEKVFNDIVGKIVSVEDKNFCKIRLDLVNDIVDFFESNLRRNQFQNNKKRFIDELSKKQGFSLTDY